jgi:uncharacterized protein
VEGRRYLLPPDGNPVSAVHVDNIILKVVQHCNLDCTYCYVYNRGDDSWQSRPPLISEAVIHKLAARIDEHCDAHGIMRLTVELHGGEPLLLGKHRMQTLINILNAECIHKPRITMQTNGTLLDRDWLELLSQGGVSFGISLDGPPEIADRRRIMRNGRGGSTQKVLDVIATLRAQGPLFDELFGGCLCVVDPQQDGAEFVEWFVEHGFTDFDFLLPDGNRFNLPQEWSGVEAYRTFLISAFDCWYLMGSRAPRIRKFELMMKGLMGAEIPLDALGGDLRRLCVVESDGSIGVSDVARICGGNYSRDLLNIFDHSLDEHIAGYRIDTVQRVCRQCQECAYLAGCGGGYLPHRFDGLTFDNPSLYCRALYALAERMMEVLRHELPPQVWCGQPHEQLDVSL